MAGKPSNTKITVWDAFYDVLRHYGMTTMFGNPGSTEEPMLKNFPSDFKYVLALQEASVVAMADGYAQATHSPVVVSLHTAAGTGNGMGTLMTASCGKTPLIVIAGQQHRDMLIAEPLLTNREETTFPKPWVKWAYQPVIAQDVPGALVRAIAMATLPPQGPVYLSIPLDDWDKEASKPVITRHVSTRFAPDPELISVFCNHLYKASALALVYGQEIDKSLGWKEGIQLAELLGAPVYTAPTAERAVFPSNHPLYRGSLPMARGPLCEATEAYDTLLVVGAEVWRYYPYVDGPIGPAGQKVLHITNDAHDAAKAIIGDALISDAKLALEGLVQGLVKLGVQQQHDKSYEMKPLQLSPLSGKMPMTALDAFTIAARHRPDNAILFQESPSNISDLLQVWPAQQTEQYFSFASGGLGFAGPASVGMALAQKMKGNAPTFLVIGDGSFHYSVQSIYTAVREKVRLIILVPRNEEYAILKEFAVLENTPAVPALDLPGLDAVAVAKAYGCQAYRADTVEELDKRVELALKADGPVLIEFAIDRELRPMIAQSSSHAK